MSLLNQPSLAIVIVTYNRVTLLAECLDSLKKQTHQAEKIFVIDNASTDNTEEFLSQYTGLPLQVIRSSNNTGGAGGFAMGIEAAFNAGYEWLFVMDDDVFPAEDCLEQLMKVGHPAMIAVREDHEGILVERSAMTYNLKNPFCLNPKSASVAEYYQKRQNMPETFEVANIAFEGFMVHRDVVAQVGFPEPKYFIFYDDVDYALRIRNAGIKILAVRDAILRRQLPFNQAGALNSWKAFFMFRNLFHVHYKFGENFLVRNKPYWLGLGAAVLALIKGNMFQAKAIFRALKTYKHLDN
jgi:rhamnopyranosyl-N-acetylglucosaminyl-diphospho-decaprenol beta-1,3/1,4-galactofuranosyltransferase